MTRLNFSLFLTTLVVSVNAEPLKSPWDFDALKSTPEFRWVESEKPIREVIYENGISYEGKATETFAFYASPETLGNTETKKPYPGVVLIHGGGGTAFSEWVNLWAKRGYAAIAMDLSGRRPPSPECDETTGAYKKDTGFQKGSRTRLEKGGPEHGHVEKFQNVGGDLTDDWQTHTVASVMRAHSLLRSFPEVDPERTAVTGISWGGYSTCLVASVDDRFKAAVPVYGCGFLYEGESVQKKMIDDLEADKRKEWIKRWDPSALLVKCEVPILFVNGTHDVHYPLDSYMKSFDVVPGEKMIRIEPRMRHGHQPGWEPAEIGIFIDSKCRGGVPLPVLSSILSKNEGLRVNVSSRTKIKSATLHFTTEKGLRSARKWEKQEATVLDGYVTVGIPPREANTWFLTVTDERDAMVSTRVTFR